MAQKREITTNPANYIRNTNKSDGAQFTPKTSSAEALSQVKCGSMVNSRFECVVKLITRALLECALLIHRRNQIALSWDGFPTYMRTKSKQFTDNPSHDLAKCSQVYYCQTNLQLFTILVFAFVRPNWSKF